MSIASLLQEAIGLDEASIGSGAVRHVIQRRIQQSTARDEAGFLALLQASKAEMTALIEEIVVPETWFFRQEEAFRFMRRHLSGEWRRVHPGQIPRLLSIPCSSGEEAYSMAMTLLDADFTARDFHIDAIDVSRQSLAKAQRAVYGKGSFRGEHLDFRQRHFRRTNLGYALQSPVRHAVHFHHGNILDHEQMKSLGAYDIIYCRNLLIYFDKDRRKRTAALLAAMLRKNGLLFVGHAETGLLWKDWFVSVPHPMTFAYRRIDSGEVVNRTVQAKKHPLAPREKIGKPAILPIRQTNQQRIARSLSPALTRSASDTDNGTKSSLETASRLANQGHLEEARQQCEACLEEQPASAQAWFLLGLINDIQDHKEQAKDAFRKALYLEPEHCEALVHLALLLDQLGDHGAARRLRDRVQRVSCRQQAHVIPNHEPGKKRAYQGE